MPRFIIPLVAALLLCSACCSHRKPCATRYCQPTAPTRPVCPQGKPAHKCKCQHSARLPKPGAISLSEVMDYLPGLPPTYLNI